MLASTLVSENEAPKSPILTIPPGARKILPPLMSLEACVTCAAHKYSSRGKANLAPHVTRDTPHVTSQTSHVTRQTSQVTRQTSHVTRHTSHVTRHTSHVTRHTSHVTRHTSHAAHDCTSPMYDSVLVQKFQPLQNLSREALNNCLGKRSKYAERFGDGAPGAELHEDGERLGGYQ